MSGLFGGGSTKVDFKPTGINAGGISAKRDQGAIQVSTSAERKGLVGSIAKTFPLQAAELAKQRAQVAPGFGRLTMSRLAEIESGRRSAIGNLAENLQRRRVLGSSFAQDAFSRAEAEFAQQRERVAAESFLQELELSNQLLQQEFEARRGEFTTGLDELNIQAEIATQLASQATAQMGANARLEAELNAQSSAGFGKLLGTVAQVGLGIATGGASTGLSAAASAAAAGGVGLL